MRGLSVCLSYCCLFSYAYCIAFRNVFGNGRIRVYASAQRPLSLFRYNGFTTEIGGSPIANGIDGSSVYPMQSIYTLGLNLNF